MKEQYLTEDGKKIICPICGETVKQLNTHITYKHGISIPEFRIKYPGCPLRVSKPASTQIFVCPHCGKQFKTNGAMQTHISYKHNGQVYGSGNTRQSRRRAAKNKGIECMICHNKFTNFKQHIEMYHKMKWEDYCKQYNYNGTCRYYDDEMKHNTSVAKKAFYQTEAGLAWKKWNGARVAGDKNSAKRKDVREKISRSREQGISNNFVGWGINIWFIRNGIEYHCRSFNEYIIMCKLLDHNIDFQYEQFKVYYTLNDIKKLHITDFKIDNIIYEVKPYSESTIKENTFKNHEKYNAINIKMNSINITYKVVNLKMMLNELKLYNNETENDFRQYMISHMDEITKIQVCRSKTTHNTFVEGKEFEQFKDKINIIRF